MIVKSSVLSGEAMMKLLQICGVDLEPSDKSETGQVGGCSSSRRGRRRLSGRWAARRVNRFLLEPCPALNSPSVLEISPDAREFAARDADATTSPDASLPLLCVVFHLLAEDHIT